MSVLSQKKKFKRSIERMGYGNLESFGFPCLSKVAEFLFAKPCDSLLLQGPWSNFEIAGRGGTISVSILGGVKDTFSY